MATDEIDDDHDEIADECIRSRKSVPEHAVQTIDLAKNSVEIVYDGCPLATLTATEEIQRVGAMGGQFLLVTLDSCDFDGTIADSGSKVRYNLDEYRVLSFRLPRFSAAATSTGDVAILDLETGRFSLQGANPELSIESVREELMTTPDEEILEGYFGDKS